MATVTLDAIQFFNPSSQRSSSSVKRTTPLHSNHRPTALPRQNEGGRALQSHGETSSMAGIASDDDDFPPIAELMRRTSGPKSVKRSSEENSSSSETVQSARADGVGRSRETPIVLNDEAGCDLDKPDSGASNVTSAGQGASLWTPPITLQDHRTGDEVSEYDGIEAKLYSTLIGQCNIAPTRPANCETDCDLDKASPGDSIATSASIWTPPTTPKDHLTGDGGSKYDGVEANLYSTLVGQRDTTFTLLAGPTTHHYSEVLRDQTCHIDDSDRIGCNWSGQLSSPSLNAFEDGDGDTVEEDEQDGENTDDDDNESSQPAKQCMPPPPDSHSVAGCGYERCPQRSSRCRSTRSSGIQQHQESSQEAEQEKDGTNSSSDNDSDENYMGSQDGDNSDGPRPAKRQKLCLVPADESLTPQLQNLALPLATQHEFTSRCVNQPESRKSSSPSLTGGEESASNDGATYQEWPLRGFFKLITIGNDIRYGMEFSLDDAEQLCAAAFPLHTSLAGSDTSFSTRPTRPARPAQPFSACTRADNASGSTQSRGKRPRFTADEDAKLVELKEGRGWSWEGIQRELPERSTIPHTNVAHSKIHTRATRPKTKRAPWTLEEDAKVLNMKKDGCSWVDILAALPGRSKVAIQVRCSTKLRG